MGKGQKGSLGLAVRTFVERVKRSLGFRGRLGKRAERFRKVPRG